MITVALADDHRILREGLRRLLEQQPDLQVVGEAANGHEALLLVRDRQPDVLILDITMPGLNGVDVCTQLRHETHTRVVVLSMHADLEFVRAAMAAGAWAYVVKDAAPEELATAVRKAVAGERFVSAQLTEGVLDDYQALLQRVAACEAQSLSPRQREVLQLLTEGLSTKQIAAALNLSARTVESHRAQVMGQTGCHSVAELTKYAIRVGITTVSS